MKVASAVYAADALPGPAPIPKGNDQTVARASPVTSRRLVRQPFTLVPLVLIPT